MKEHCDRCGRYHEITTAGCPFIPIVYENVSKATTLSTIEDKLDEIIRMLREIEYIIKTK